MQATVNSSQPMEASLSPARNGRKSPVVPGRSALESAWAANGWLTLASPYGQRRSGFSLSETRDITLPQAGGSDAGAAGVQRLTCHADWLGPRKLVCIDGEVQQLVEVYVSHDVFADQVFDADFETQRAELFDALSETVFADRLPADHDRWQCPSPEKLAAWLTDGGFQPAIDGDGDLRLALKARGRDGQVRVRCQPQSVRMSMPIGTWADLDDVREAAMIGLAGQANDHGRLARIVWIREGKSCRCEAQVDLTGLPTAGPAERLWPDMLTMSMHGLTLALRRTVIELDALAHVANRDLAAQWMGSQFQADGTVPVANS